MKKTEVLRALQSARADFHALLAGLSPEQMIEPGVLEGWSVKDMLVHIAWYEREEAELVGETGVEASPLWEVPQDPRNELLREQNRDRPLEGVLTEFDQAFDALVSAVDWLTDEDLVTPGRFLGTAADLPPWKDIAGNSFEHEREHIEMIREWLQRDRS